LYASSLFFIYSVTLDNFGYGSASLPTAFFYAVFERRSSAAIDSASSQVGHCAPAHLFQQFWYVVSVSVYGYSFCIMHVGIYKNAQFEQNKL
jgi:hypothetical protein